MISLERVAADGWATVERNFQALQQLTIDTGGISTYQRIVSGGITNGGAKNYGTGFSVSRTGVGVYVVVFTRPFPASPAVSFGSDNGTPLATFWTAGSANGFTANVVNLAAAAVDAYINFTATYIA
jgi:hypothetical protein